VATLKSLAQALKELQEKQQQNSASASLISEIHSVVLDLYTLLPSPLSESSTTSAAVDKEGQRSIFLEERRLEFLSLLADCMKYLGPTLLTAALPSPASLEKQLRASTSHTPREIIGNTTFSTPFTR